MGGNNLFLVSDDKYPVPFVFNGGDIVCYIEDILQINEVTNSSGNICKISISYNLFMLI